LKKEKFSQENKEIIDEIFLNIPEVKAGKMFGYPAYYVNNSPQGGAPVIFRNTKNNKKLVAFLYYEGIVVKVPDDLYKSLIISETRKAEPFLPLNKGTGKNWVVIYRDTPEEFQQDYDIFGVAVQYILSLTQGK
jgi:hypothetical protein